MSKTDEEWAAQFAQDVLDAERNGYAPPRHEVKDLAENYLKLWELMRWRKWPEEKPTGSGVFQIYELWEEEFAPDPFEHGKFAADKFDQELGEWDMGNDSEFFYRPIGNLPPQLFKAGEPKQRSLFP